MIEFIFQVKWHDVACYHRKHVLCEDSETLLDYVKATNEGIKLWINRKTNFQWIVLQYVQLSKSLSMFDTPEDCPRNEKKQATSSIGNFCKSWHHHNPLLSSILAGVNLYLVPNSRTIESQKLGPMHVPEHPKSGKHPSQPPVHNVWVFAARLTANLLMVPSILGDQTAQHGHYKSGGDGVEGEAEISGRWQEKVGLKQGEVNLILTTLGESRLIPQWQSWARSTEGQSWRTERQN